MLLRCPNCQGIFKEGMPSSQCPHCGEDLSKLLTPLETGMMTDFGLTLLAAATGLFVFIALANYAKEFRSLFVFFIVVFGSSLMAWGRSKSLTAKERFSWEQVWVTLFCGSIGAFEAVLMGLNFMWALALACLGLLFGHIVCDYAKRNWQKERKR